MKKLSTIFIIGVVLVLTACGSDKKDEETAAQEDKKLSKEIPICPQVAILRDLQEMKDYATENPDPAQLVAQARMKTIDGDCEYTDDGIDVRFNLSLIAAKGPRLGGLHASFPFFAAVVDPSKTVLSKETMTSEFGFSSSSKIAEYQETLHVFIPLPKKQRQTGPQYQVLLGFQLTEDQLKAVRSQP